MIPSECFGSGWWRIAPDEAIVLDVVPAGHAEGVWTVRWLEAASHPLPRVRVVRFADLAGA